ncbi:MAG: M20/M25/M40 family metallo-hydrolase [Deltaproteobacteria bacterium]|nr:M20/M25/M40 family metallo-hydrolase [Deltaproteobacteria bacterium]
MDQAISWLKLQRPSMERLLEELVLVSSHSLDKSGCNKVGEVLRRAVPLPCEVVPGKNHGDHLFFHAPTPGCNGGVVLVGHLDTVFPREAWEGWTTDGVLGRGPGALDMKGGLVVVAFALQALVARGLLGALPLTFAVVSDEELGSPESAELLRERARGARSALVFEAGRAGDRVVTARKGTGTLEAVAHGRAAHAGNHHRDGANAIRAMARFVEAAEGLTDHARGVTVNVGKIAGGVAKNSVPALCRAWLDLRFEEPSQGPELLAGLRALAATELLPGTRLELREGAGRAPLVATDASRALAERYGACAAEAGLGRGEAPRQGGGSDASTTASVGVPSVDGLGPRGAGFHTLDERVELASLVPKAEALVRLLARGG